MRKKISEIIEVPKDIVVKLGEGVVELSKNGLASETKLAFPVKHEGNKIIIEDEKPTKNDKKLIKSLVAHIKNMIAGLQEKYVYKLQICAVHFPMNVVVKGNELIIKNFLGEVKERKAEILPGVNIKIEKEFITLEGHDKNKTGQTAANIESATKICNRDRRVFQDGIYITQKQKGVKK